MLELKNISKTYKLKKDNKVQALNNISLRFNNNGMTFILGKSGSGKSTLLNIIGGLDKYDNGDMLIFNKSTKDFNTKDFDNYRNNYIGFVFQEFNIIEDYNVIDNIKLALKLQNKEINEKEIDELLGKLEIKEYKNRKVNELSGGQKQRVAIARALIKKPKIILADEPTGNLDSKTGIEVMNLLKEISKETLVIVVSHDKEFANKYGDRVIELEDGKVMNDTNIIDNIDVSDNYKISKSKLPLKDAIKLGTKSLNKKKIRLLCTILLISFSTIFLLLAFIMKTYDADDNHLKLLIDKKIDTLEIKKYNYREAYGDTAASKWETNLKNKDVELIKKDLNHNNYLVYSLQNEPGLVKFFNLNIYIQEDLFSGEPEEEKNLYTIYANKLQIIELEKKEDLIKEDIIGKFPIHNDEIMISNYIANIIMENGIYEYNTDTIYYPKDYNELVNSNKLFSFGSSNSIKIVGIIKYDLSKYDYLKNIYNSSKNIKRKDFSNQYEIIQLNNTILNKIYTKVGFIDNLKSNSLLNLSNDNQYVLFLDNQRLNNSINAISTETEYYNGTDWVKTDTLNKNEAIISIFSLLSEEEYSKYFNELNSYIAKYPNRDKMLLEKEFMSKYSKLKNYIGKDIELKIYENTPVFSQTYNKKEDSNNKIKIIGISGLSNSNQVPSLFSKDLLDDYIDKYASIDGIILRENNQNELRKIITKFPHDGKYSVYTMYSLSVESYNEQIKTFKSFILIGMITFLVFSILLISNFMFNSISNRKKDIGILKSLGSKDIDIIKIFISEGIFLSIISSIVSIIMTIVLFNVLNNTTMKTEYSIISPFYINIKPILITFIYILFVVLLSSIVPLIKISKMKPIDAIYNR